MLLGLAHPPFHLLFPSFVAPVPFALWLSGLPPGEAGRREARRGGFLLGLVYYALLLHWLFTALVWYTWLAALAFVVPVLILSGLMALTAWGIHETRRQLRWPLWLCLPVFWTANEWLRAHLGDVSFPWMQLGDTLTGYPWLVGAADLVGSRGLSLWLVLVGGLVAELVLRWRARRGRPGAPTGGGSGGPSLVAPALGLALALALPAGYSLYRWETLRTRPAARVAVIQPDVPEHVKLDAEAAIDSALASTARLVEGRRERWRGELDLVVLPEVTVPEVLEPGTRGRFGRAPELRDWVVRLAADLGADVLIGAYGYDRDGGGTLYNSAFLVDEAGRWAGRYDKMELVPIVERVPFVNPRWLGFLGPYFGGLGEGERPGVYALDDGAPEEAAPAGEGGVGDEGDAEFGVLICYESIFSELARAYRRRGADFLVNITNDAWFGRERPWWSRSSALYQHPAHLVMRAVETRVGIVRAANTGISALVDPRGRTHRETALFTPAALAGAVETTAGATLYVRTGDLLGRSSALTVAALVALLAWRRRHSSRERRTP